jgi:hypothetical protein
MPGLHEYLVVFQSYEYELFPRSFINGLFTVIAILLAWRFWTFTVVPLLYPQNPRELPYWVPGILNLIPRIAILRWLIK